MQRRVPMSSVKKLHKQLYPEPALVCIMQISSFIFSKGCFPPKDLEPMLSLHHAQMSHKRVRFQLHYLYFVSLQTKRSDIAPHQIQTCKWKDKTVDMRTRLDIKILLTSTNKEI